MQTYLTPEERKVLDAIMDLLNDMEVSAHTGERVMLWAAGCSLGLRMESLTTGPAIEPLARGWQTAVSHG